VVSERCVNESLWKPPKMRSSGFMRVRRKLKANQENDFACNTSRMPCSSSSDKITGPIAGILAAISSIALLVGKYRRDEHDAGFGHGADWGEIGIRKAVGATRQEHSPAVSDRGVHARLLSEG